MIVAGGRSLLIRTAVRINHGLLGKRTDPIERVFRNIPAVIGAFQANFVVVVEDDLLTMRVRFV